MTSLTDEIKVINKAFAEFKVMARIPVDGKGCMIARSSHISYRLQRGKGQRIQPIEKLLPELTEVVTDSRGTSTPVRLLTAPLCLEVSHPEPTPLTWSSAKTLLSSHTMLAGKRYQMGKPPAAEAVRFGDTPHVLVCGVTGAGKSVMMASMLSTLCLNTSPQDLRILLIDLKNEDMIPFANLPHVERFAGLMEDAESAIGMAITELDNRIARPGHKPYRLVVWIDEVAEIAQNTAIQESLGRLASAGRSKDINLVAATTHPTEKGGLGSLMKANFPLRLVGMVASGQSYAATQRKGLYADFLPGKGSFLRVEGNGAPRFQSHFIDDNDLTGLIAEINDKWAGVSRSPVGALGGEQVVRGGEQVVRGGEQVVRNDILTGEWVVNGGEFTGEEPVHHLNQPENADLFPISQRRPFTGEESVEVRRLADSKLFDYRGELSLNRLSDHVYGTKCSSRLEWIKDALASTVDANPDDGRGGL